MGSYTSVHNDTKDIMMIKYGPHGQALAISGLSVGLLGALFTGGASLAISGAALAAGACTAAGAGIGIAEFVRKCEENGMHRVEPDGWYKSEKLTLSLVHQANIVLINPKTNRVRKGVLTVWSGPTDDSCNCYKASSATFD